MQIKECKLKYVMNLVLVFPLFPPLIFQHPRILRHRKMDNSTHITLKNVARLQKMWLGLPTVVQRPVGL